MANNTGNEGLLTTPSNSQWEIVANFAVPNTQTTFYAKSFVGRDGSGNVVLADDTQKYELLGIQIDLTRVTVDTTDTVGDKDSKFQRPLTYVAKIASAAAGDEGKAVFVLYNNQVQYTGGSYANFAGWVYRVVDSTHVECISPWFHHVTAGGDRGVFSAAAAADTTLTKWHVNQVTLLPLTASQNINLPAASKTSPGDKITLINTSANTSTPTVVPAGADTINGSASYTMSTTQYAIAVLRSDGSSKWYVEVPGPSGTVGSTTFSGNVAVSSATLTVTDNSANTFDVGPNGATNPTLQIDCSTGSAATGLKVKSAAAAGGLALSVISSGAAENLTLDAKGSGTITIGGTSTGAITLGQATTVSGNLTMADAKNVVLNTTTGTKIGTATSQKLAFYNSTPVVQPAANTDTTTSAAGSTTSVFLNTTFTGGTGSSAYTIGGILSGLKALGLLAA